MTSHHHQNIALARKSSELAFAAPQVIALRLLRMAQHGTEPTARDRAELFRMGNEKFMAFSQAWVAMCMQCWLAPLQLLRGDWARAGSRTATALMTAGIVPVHRAAVANAKRLSRRRR